MVFICCIFALWLVTAQHGIGYTHDSFGYKSYGDVLRTEGLGSPTTLYTVFPPLYPAILTLLGNDDTVIRWVHILVAGTNAVLFVRLLQLAGVKSKALTGAVTLTLFLSPGVMYYHGSILSEGVFLLLLQLATITTLTHRWKWALLFVVLATLQRFIGVVVIIPCAMLLWRSQDRFRAIVFTITAGSPLGLWILRNALLSEQNSRQLGWHPVSLDHLAGVWEFAVYWIIPLFAILLLTRIVGKVSSDYGRLSEVSLFAGVFISLYLIFLILHISLLDFAVPMNNRLLQPVLVVGAIPLTRRLDHQWLVITNHRGLKVLTGFIFAGYGIANLIAIGGYYVTGVGYM